MPSASISRQSGRARDDVNDLIEPMVAELTRQGLANFPDQGNEIIPVKRNDDKKDLPPLLVVSSEGSAMYGTTDLATIVDRKALFRARPTPSMWSTSGEPTISRWCSTPPRPAGYAVDGELGACRLRLHERA